MAEQSRPTIRDVAAHAGVSYQTVSRVINDSGSVRPATQARVEAAIAELGFRANAIAQFMATGSTRTLTCLSPNLTDYTFACIIEGAEQEARQQGYFLFSASAPDESTFDLLVDQMIASRRTEGLLVINPYADNRFTLLPDTVPTVFVGARPRAESVELGGAGRCRRGPSGDPTSAGTRPPAHRTDLRAGRGRLHPGPAGRLPGSAGRCRHSLR